MNRLFRGKLSGAGSVPRGRGDEPPVDLMVWLVRLCPPQARG